MDSQSFDVREVKKVLEAALLTSGEPIAVAELKKLFDEEFDNDTLRRILAELAHEWNDRSVEPPRDVYAVYARLEA